MSEWIKCKDELPPVGKFVMISKRMRMLEIVKRTETSEPYFWIFPSGMRYGLLEPSDEWQEIEEEQK